MNQSRFRFIIRAFVLGLFVIFNSACQETLTATKQPKKEPEKIIERRVTFLAVGDIMMSRGVAAIIARTDNPLLPFKKMEGVLRSTDFNFGNLENPIPAKINFSLNKLVFGMREKNVTGLKDYNFQILNLANNHALDQKPDGLRNTQKILAKNRLSFIGVGDNLEQAWQPKMIIVKEIKIGFVGASYASENDGGVARNEYVARIEDTERLKRAIEKLKSNGADFIVATMHAGVEYTRQPHPPQISFARAAIDFGADIVIGSHPHWIQTFEQYKGKYIFYSLGNFIFDQDWSRDTKEGLTLKITINRRESSVPNSSSSGTNVERIELIPVVIENFSTPRLADEAEAREILRKIGVTERVLTNRL